MPQFQTANSNSIVPNPGGPIILGSVVAMVSGISLLLQIDFGGAGDVPPNESSYEVFQEQVNGGAGPVSLGFGVSNGSLNQTFDATPAGVGLAGFVEDASYFWFVRWQT